MAAELTEIPEFYETLRFLLGDRDPAFQQYPDAVLLAAVRSCIRLNKAPGYTLAANLTQIIPGLVDPNQWALVAYHTVKGFVDSNPDRYAYKTRAISETFGSWRGFLDELKLNVYRLECGTMFSGWYNYYTWLSGMSGLPLDTVYAELKVRAPFYAVSLGTDSVSLGEVPNSE